MITTKLHSITVKDTPLSVKIRTGTTDEKVIDEVLKRRVYERSRIGFLLEPQDKWLDPDSKYKEYRRLQIDKRGSFGERFFSQVLSQIYFRRLAIEYNNGDQGDWNLKLKEMIEIKSLRDIQNEFKKHFSFLFKKGK